MQTDSAQHNPDGVQLEAGWMSDENELATPHALPCFAAERAWAVNTCAIGENATLYALDED